MKNISKEYSKYRKNYQNNFKFKELPLKKSEKVQKQVEEFAELNASDFFKNEDKPCIKPPKVLKVDKKPRVKRQTKKRVKVKELSEEEGSDIPEEFEIDSNDLDLSDELIDEETAPKKRDKKSKSSKT
jgi:hypothetical protein